MTCKHEYYKHKDGETERYMTVKRAERMMKAGEICWTGKVVQTCCDCGESLIHQDPMYNVVPVQGATEYIKKLMLSDKVKR